MDVKSWLTYPLVGPFFRLQCLDRLRSIVSTPPRVKITKKLLQLTSVVISMISRTIYVIDRLKLISTHEARTGLGSCRNPSKILFSRYSLGAGHDSLHFSPRSSPRCGRSLTWSIAWNRSATHRNRSCLNRFRARVPNSQSSQLGTSEVMELRSSIDNLTEITR